MRTITAVLAVVLASPSAAPAADYDLPRRAELDKYSGLWHAVHDLRAGAAGRNVRADLVRTPSGRLRRASAREVARSIDRLRTMALYLRADRRLAMLTVRVGGRRLPSASRVPEPVTDVGPHLRSIRACESHGDYRASGGGGKFRGAFQFSWSTWSAVGGRGDPAAAPRREQDMRAAMLYESGGPGHWPVCQHR